MGTKINLANFTSVFRVGIAFLAIAALLQGDGIIFMVTIAVSVFLDVVDGILARWLRCQSHFGETLDHTADYIVANSVWIALAGVGLLPIWIPIITIARDLFVSFQKKTSKTKFQWLSSSRKMRALYGTLKLISWEVIVLNTFFSVPFASEVAWVTVVLCLIRALPTFISTRSNKGNLFP